MTVIYSGTGRDQNRLRIEDIGNYTCQVTSEAITQHVDKLTYLSIECKLLYRKFIIVSFLKVICLFNTLALGFSVEYVKI